MQYRTDIDGLRSLAVLSVIFFHLGYLPHGFLGVDIFFVISGYLITGIVYHETAQNKFSVLKFYERRLRRIIPLLLFTTLTAFILGLFYMLPDDLENLSQSVFASNFSANNILMYITSRDYWAVKNDFKPLMHTWSLGIEEQFYLLYPFIFIFLKGKKLKFIFPTLLVLTVLSLLAFVLESNVSAKFYFIQYRFFELSVGGLCAIHFNSPRIHSSSSKYVLYVFLIALALLLFLPLIESFDVKIISTIMLSAGILVLGKESFQGDKLYKGLFSNKIVTGIGKISYSLYMWHQVVFAFARYFLVTEITAPISFYLLLITFLLSVLSYHLIENPFRNRNQISTKYVLAITGVIFISITAFSFYVYSIGGIIKDFPALGLYKDNLPDKRNFFSSTSNIHMQYNEDVRKLEENFTATDKVRTLVIGDSFGRDIANILLESEIQDSIEVRYFDINRAFSSNKVSQMIMESDYLFIAANLFIGEEFISRLEAKYDLDIDNSKLWVFGTKDFGYSNGIHYNRINNKTNFLEYRTPMKKGYLQIEEKLRKEWRQKYVSLIDLIKDEEGNVLVFTPEGKFISQDTAHLTKPGAIFFARKLKSKLRTILQ